MKEVILIVVALVVIIFFYKLISDYLVNFLYDKKILSSKELTNETNRLTKKLEVVLARNSELKSLYTLKNKHLQMLQERDEDIKNQREREELLRKAENCPQVLNTQKFLFPKEKPKEILDAEKELRRKYTLKHCLKNYKNQKRKLSKEEVGARFERQIGYMYENAGMNVSYNGIYKKFQDDGIDLIIKDKKTHILIQCKNYSAKHNVHSNTIAQLVGDSLTYELEHPDIEVKRMLITSNDNLDDRAKEYLKLHKTEHFVKQYSLDYPLIKCKKESMIYHLPCNANYDMIKINIKRGDSYIETEEEAVQLGYRLANN